MATTDYYDSLYMEYALEKSDDFPPLMSLLSLGKDPPAHVLDLCGGFGRVARLLALRGYDVTVVDRSRRLLDLGREWLKDESRALQRKIRFLRGDCSHLCEEIAPDRFHLALCAHFAVNEMLDSPRPIFANAARGLRSDGILVLQALPRRWTPVDSRLRPAAVASGGTATHAVYASSQRIDTDCHLLRTVYVPAKGVGCQEQTRELMRRFWAPAILREAAGEAGLFHLKSLPGGFHAFRMKA